MSLFASQPGFEVEPASSQIAGTPIGTFETVSIVDGPFTVNENSEISASFFQPLLNSGESPKGNDQDTSIEFCKFGLVVTQLCDVLSAGYSAKVTEEDQ